MRMILGEGTPLREIGHEREMAMDRLLCAGLSLLAFLIWPGGTCIARNCGALLGVGKRKPGLPSRIAA
jgi:hypothetical protein